MSSNPQVQPTSSSPSTSSPSQSTSSPTSNTTNSPSSSNPDPQRTSEARTAFLASLTTISQNYDTHLRDRARDLHSNSAAIASQETQLANTTTELGKQNDQLGKLADQAREGLKEIGDVQNWAELIERDLVVVEEMLRGVEEKDWEEGLFDREGQVNGEGVNGGENGKKKGWMKWW